jgi:hypothetical protein
MAALSGGYAMKRRSAARLKLRSSATAMKYRRCLRSSIRSYPPLTPPRPSRVARPDEAAEHSSEFDPADPGGDHRIAVGERTNFVLVLGLDDAEAPRARVIEHRSEKHHSSRVDERLPMSRVPRHDLPLIVAHVEREGGAWRYEPEDEGAGSLVH